MNEERSFFLFDLDGTLTDISEDEFARKYFSLIAEHSDGTFEMTDFFRAINIALDSLTSNRDGKKNNYELFMEVFASKMPDHDVSFFESFFSDFYSSSYKELSRIVRPNDRMISTLLGLKEMGFHIVLATNPIFPEEAIFKRLFWIGLDPEIFSHVTTMENSHYVKPQVEYYLEAASAVSAEPEECIMIGNDAVLDGASTKAGMVFVHVKDLEQLERVTEGRKNQPNQG